MHRMSKFAGWVAVAAIAMLGCKGSSAPESSRQRETGSDDFGGKGGSHGMSTGSGSGAVVGSPVGGDGNGPGGGELESKMITFGELTAMGDIDKSAVKHVVKQNTQKLQTCYEQTLMTNPGVESEVIVKFTIGIDGGVTALEASGIPTELVRCVTIAFKAFRFPKPANGKVDVEYPLSFKPG
jgi:hypothetical protein